MAEPSRGDRTRGRGQDHRRLTAGGQITQPALIIDAHEPDAEGSLVRDRSEGANHALGERENLVLLAREALHVRVVLQRGRVAELVDRSPEGKNLIAAKGDALIFPPGEVLRIERDLEAGLPAERLGEVGEVTCASKSSRTFVGWVKRAVSIFASRWAAGS